jgi:hypothetical protein
MSIPGLPDALAPTTVQRQRIARALWRELEAERASLLDEWLALLRARPVLHGCYALAAALLLLWMAPLAALPLRLLAA